jgi:cyclopropane fatty-acyl-phospholipid synthase-like methyltransferase
MSEKWYQPKNELLEGQTPKKYQVIEKILSNVAKGRLVLDIGCNAGLVSLLSGKHGARQVCGVDKREYTVKQAREALKAWQSKGLVPKKTKVGFKSLSLASDLKLVDNSDMIIAIRVLYHLQKDVFELFDRIKDREDMILLLQGNRARAEKAKAAPDGYGNSLALEKGMVKLLKDYNFVPVVIDDEIIFAYHKDAKKAWSKKDLLKQTG